MLEVERVALGRFGWCWPAHHDQERASKESIAEHLGEMLGRAKRAEGEGALMGYLSLTRSVEELLLALIVWHNVRRIEAPLPPEQAASGALERSEQDA